MGPPKGSQCVGRTEAWQAARRDPRDMRLDVARLVSRARLPRELTICHPSRVLTAADPERASAGSLRRPRRERWAVAALAAFAALRVALFAASFPFFTNVDEHRHVDLAWKYSHAAPPRAGAVPYEPEMPEWVAGFGAPDYQLPPGAA